MHLFPFFFCSRLPCGARRFSRIPLELTGTLCYYVFKEQKASRPPGMRMVSVRKAVCMRKEQAMDTKEDLPVIEEDPPFEAKPFYQKVVKIGIPIALQALLTQFVEASDTLMLGFLSQDAMSAISLATQVHFVLNMIFVSINVVIATMAAQYWGKKDHVTVEKILAFSLKIAVGSALIFFIGAFFLPELLMKFFTDDPVLIDLGIQYLRIVSFSYLFLGVAYPFLSILKNTGRVTKSSIFSSTAVVLNLVFNALLIYGLFGFPKMGIQGAALATVISRGVEMLLCIIETAFAKKGKFRFRYVIHDDRPVRVQFLKLLPGILGNMAVWGVGQTAFSAIIGHLGSDAVAANSLASIAQRLGVCFCNGVGNGSSVIIGHELGANHLKLAKIYAKKLLILSVIIGVISGFILFLLSPVIVRVAGVSLTDQAKEYLQYMLYMMCFYEVGKAANTVFVHGCFYAGGDMKFGLICDAINLWGFIIPIGFLLAFVFNAPVILVYCFLRSDEIIKVPAEIIHYKKYGWVRNITLEREKQQSSE